METVKINIVPKGAVKAAHASQGDNPRIVRFELFDEFLPYTLDGSEDITLTVVRPDTEEIVSSVTNTEEAYIDVSFTSEMTAIRGVANCEIKISKSGAVIGSHNFDLNIERGAYGEDITVETAQGVIATFTTGVIDNLVGLKTTFEPKQDLHGFDSPWIDSNVVNKAPYLSRALAGTASRIGNYEFNKLVGGTYAFNQLVYDGDFSENPTPWRASSGSTDLTINNGEATFTASRAYAQISSVSHAINVISGHKYFCSVEGKTNESNKQLSIGTTTIGNTYKAIGSTYTKCETIRAASSSASNEPPIIVCLNSIDGEKYTVRNAKIIDLTQLFCGSTIADYIYNLETAQAGAGVSFFKAIFDKDYFHFNVGELISVKPTAHITKDGNNTVISNTALDPDIELRGIPKLDENNNLYYDGDTYESNGGVTRRLSSATLDGNLNPNNLGVTVLDNYTQVSYLPYMNIGVGIHSPFLCDKHFINTQAPSAEIKEGDIYNSGVATAPRMFLALPKTVTTAAEAVAWFANNPTTVLFYIATPTTESADSFADPQEIDPNGSEEFTDNRSVPIPVGHESYYANICEIEGIDSITFYHSGEDTQDPESVTVEIGQTVYGGYYDKDLGIVLNKKLVDLGSLTWTKDTTTISGATFFRAILSDAKNAFTALCSVYRFVGSYSYLVDKSCSYVYNNRIAVMDSTYDNYTADDFTTAMNGVTLCYDLADPIIIPADAVNFETVKGVNNVWSDTNGETEVEFYVKES